LHQIAGRLVAAVGHSPTYQLQSRSMAMHRAVFLSGLVNALRFRVLSYRSNRGAKEVEILLMSGLIDTILAVYPKLVSWKFRDRFGSPLLTWLMALKGNSVQFKDYKVFLNPRDKTATELFLIHVNSREWIWESYELELFTQAILANESPVVIDMGANYGAYTLSACTLAKSGSVKNVIAVEPNSATFSCLKRSVEAVGFGQFAQLVNAAVADNHNGECDFYVDERYSAMSKSLAGPDVSAASNSPTSSYKVRCISIDGLLSEVNIEKTNNFVIKIDVEGSEPLAFQGMKTTLESAAGYQIFFEFHPDALKSCGHDPLKLAQHIFELQPDLIVEIQHEKKIKRISSLADFESIIDGCLTTTELWKDYTNIFLSKNATLPAEMRRLLGRETD
jgi:FkbM family methyltransferase